MDPARVFPGKLLIVAPHMDDEVLACGGTIACLPQKDRIHVLYATDGSRSPTPRFRWQAPVTGDLATIRRQEAMAALGELGVPGENLYFLSLPDGRLAKHASAFVTTLAELIRRLRPAHLLIPFRFDRHPDHLAAHRAATKAVAQSGYCGDVFEYFVYYRWRLLPGGDVRRYLRPEQVLLVDTAGAVAQKRQALRRFQSQTTRYFDWQDRPILTAASVEAAASATELFLRQDAASPGTAVFARWSWWILLAHYLEPRLKRRKDDISVLVRTFAGRHARS